ncbi:hypothetical protein WJX72_005301 [[Myrmecia] bisecta]|uniref:Methionine aminopeptidase n=1 Tax=[Myrmecia] bisecta TaxID=41462 RepID=A0AAW1Q785_9CHLO
MRPTVLGAACLRGASAAVLCTPRFLGQAVRLQHGRCLPARQQRAVLGAEARGRQGLSELLNLRKPAPSNSRPVLQPGKVSPRLEVPAHIPRPSYVDKNETPWVKEYQIHDAAGIEKMRAAGKLAAEVLNHAGTLVRPGVTTDEIDKAVHKMIIEAGAYPSPLTYGNFPKSVCTSVNECVCHGIPDSRPLQDGDIINIDVTVYLSGYHGDTSRTFFCGEVSPEAKWLVEANKQALEAAIKECGPGVRFQRIGKVCSTIAKEAGLKICQDFVGHGVGWAFHSMPMVHHTPNNEPDIMRIGQTFTIEPIFVNGNPRCKPPWKDKWTVVCADGSLAAQCEHTILITKDGHEVLTVA